MQVLAIGAHPDDIELGCGATLLVHRANGDRITLLVMTQGEEGGIAGVRQAEQERAAELLGARLLWGGFTDGAVPDGQPAVGRIEEVIGELRPDIVYLHFFVDSHQDHRTAATASAAAARHLSRLLFYEAPTSLGFHPTLFVDVDAMVEQKLELLRCHRSQLDRPEHPFELDAVAAQMRFRGSEAQAHNAEGFWTDRFLLDLPVAGVEEAVVSGGRATG